MRFVPFKVGDNNFKLYETTNNEDAIINSF
ncbi:Hypothetical protein SSCIU_01790 [Mammaliicoccus sciuri]|nr:Hypothetical protein SSCIU_01790 [Mammaliicoccus sciuri]